MTSNDWRRRIDRADELADRYSFATEILRFYAAIARFQEKFYRDIDNSAVVAKFSLAPQPFQVPLDREVAGDFPVFLSEVEKTGPAKLRDAARDIAEGIGDSHLDLLTRCWEGQVDGSEDDISDFFARAFLQPFVVSVRTRAQFQWKGPTAFVCPFCKRKPVVGVLRPLGDGGQRSLICSFCLAEWEFRRILCPGCGEMDPAKLPVYAAEELPHVRVDACDSCKTYLKTVDFTKTALGEPVVDEVASVPLDLWARQRGYTKLQVNLLQL